MIVTDEMLAAACKAYAAEALTCDEVGMRAALESAHDAEVGALRAEIAVLEDHAAMARALLKEADNEADAAESRLREAERDARRWREHFVTATSMRYMDNGLMHLDAHNAAEKEASELAGGSNGQA